MIVDVSDHEVGAGHPDQLAELLAQVGHCAVLGARHLQGRESAGSRDQRAGSSEQGAASREHGVTQVGGVLGVLECGVVALRHGLPALQVHLAQEGHGVTCRLEGQVWPAETVRQTDSRDSWDTRDSKVRAAGVNGW